PAKIEDARRHGFDIHTPDRVYSLFAEDAETFQRWMVALRIAIEEAVLERAAGNGPVDATRPAVISRTVSEPALKRNEASSHSTNGSWHSAHSAQLRNSSQSHPPVNRGSSAAIASAASVAVQNRTAS